MKKIKSVAGEPARITMLGFEVSRKGSHALRDVGKDSGSKALGWETCQGC